jgi:SPP1 gp7 family putative phage head morphogenesis protein
MTKSPDDFEQLLRQVKKGVDADNALIERRLAQMYRDAYKAVDDQIKDLYARLGDKMSLPEAQKYKRLEAVQKSIADEYRRMTGNTLRLSIDTSAQNYSEAWYRFAWAGDQALALELGWGVLPVDAIRASVYSENSGLTIIKTFRKNAKQNLSQIQSALTRGIATGQGYAKTAESIKKSFGNGYNDAIRVVRTESGRNWTEGQLKANEKAQDLGINTGKFWSAALDTRTRASHGELDGNRADEDGNFHSILGCVGPGPRLLAGVESAADNINCRCSLDFRIEGISPQLRRIRGMDDPVPYTTFKDWATPKGWTQAGGWPKAKGI